MREVKGKGLSEGIKGGDELSRAIGFIRTHKAKLITPIIKLGVQPG